MSERHQDEKEIDFELPELEDGPTIKPRIHVAPGDSACTSCEG